jgi:tetratricopeptide (TPR) repeat protein/tRNA A-37 threonylcarbamoyl transferase component Bud32
MPETSADRNLLFGLLALQMDFVTRDALITAMNTWVLAKDKPLSQVLQSQGTLAAEDDGLLNSLVCRFMEKHDNDARRSLASVTTLSAIWHDLEKIGDPDLSRTLNYIPNCAEQRGQVAASTVPHAAAAESFGGARFRLVKFHAKGGLGEVWVAHDTELNRDVALKQIQKDRADDRQSQARFLHEAEVTGRLEHRGIVPVYGLGHFENGRPFYAMRFVSGTSLKQAIAKFHEAKAQDTGGVERSLELRRLLSTFVDVCNTVAYAHSRGVLHRDLKPANIILDEYGETLVVDWGLAKTGSIDVESASNGGTLPPVSTSSTPYTWAGTKMGTPGYMSPEQATGRLSDVGPTSDVYSLGATLYCLLTGRAPLVGTDLSIILPSICAGDFPRPREVESTVPVALEAICLKAMAVSPESRYASPRALGAEIERWLADQPVLAYPEPFPARAIRWVRRRRQWVAAAAVVLILTVLGLAIYNWQITRQRDRLAMTQDALHEALRVSGENLASIPNTEKLRERLARLQLDRYRQIVAKFGTDPGIQLEMAQVYRVIGGIGRISGQFANSKESYEKAIQLLTILSQNGPGTTEYSRWLVETFSDLGELNHMNGHTIDAENNFHAAIGHADKLRSAPFSATYRGAMGSALINLSEILVLKCQYAEAYTAADQAIKVLEQPVGPGAGPNYKNRDQWLLSMALTDRGVASREAGDRDRAARDFDEAAEVAGSIAPDDEYYNDAQFQLACIANQRGELVITDQSKIPESEKNYEQAYQTLTRLITNHKLIPYYREEMAVTLCGRAGVRLAMARIPDAQRDCEAALDHLAWLIGEQTRTGAPENPQYLSLLGQVLARQSEVHFRGRRTPEGRNTHALAVEKLSRAIELDSARAADKVLLDHIKARPAR